MSSHISGCTEGTRFPNGADQAAAGHPCRNGENQRKRENLHRLEQEYQKINEQMEDLLKKQKQVLDDLAIARKSAKDLQDGSTAELEESIANIEEINGRCGPTWTKIKQKRRQGL